MARSEARLQFGMWRTGLDGRSAHAKLVYAVLLTEPTLSQCGVGAVRLSRWARDASLTTAETEKALSELAGDDPMTAQVLIDDDTEEVLVRTLIRNDGVANQPYVLKGALKEALQVVSPLLRRVLASELRKLPPRQPDGVSKAGKPVTYPDPHATADLLDPPPPAVEPSQKGFETLLDGAANPSETLHGGGGGSGGGTSSTEVTTSRKPARERAGRRIPDDFAVTPAMAAWCQSEHPHIDGRRETEKFIDHWTAASGQSATKRDWSAAWRNWMRNASERAPRSGVRHLAPVQPPLPADPSEAVAVVRSRADARAVAEALGIRYRPDAQLPSDPTPPDVYDRQQALAFIEAHAADYASALAERNAG